MRRIAYYALCAVVFILPFENMLIISPTLSPARIIGLITAALSLAALLEGKELRMPSVPMYMLGLFVAWCALSLTWTISLSVSTGEFIRLLNLTFFLWLVWEFARTRNDFLGLLRVFLLGHIVPFAMVLTNRKEAISNVSDDEVVRVTGGGQDLNYLAEMMVLGVMISVYLIHLTPPRSLMRPLSLHCLARLMPVK